MIKEKKIKGTWSALRYVKKKIKNNFFVLNGDTLYNNINFSLFNNSQLKKKRLVMMITNNHHYSENQKLKGIFIDSKKNIIYQ